jgi:hypothetical protein
MEINGQFFLLPMLIACCAAHRLFEEAAFSSCQVRGLCWLPLMPSATIQKSTCLFLALQALGPTLHASTRTSIQSSLDVGQQQAQLAHLHSYASNAQHARGLVVSGLHGSPSCSLMSISTTPRQPHRFAQTLGQLQSVQQAVHLWLTQQDSLRPSHKAQLCLHAAQLLQQSSRRQREGGRGRLHWLMGEVAATLQVCSCTTAGMGYWLLWWAKQDVQGPRISTTASTQPLHYLC